MNNKTNAPAPLEDIVRDKFATGYDPITLNVSARAMNENNVEVFIEGKLYSISGNNVVYVDKKGKVVVAEAATAGEPQTGLQEPVEVAASLGASSDAKELTELMPIKSIMEAYGATQYGPAATAGNGDTIFELYNDAGSVLATGTWPELDAFVRTAAQNQAAAEAVA